jgi:hypothetical protein
VSVPVSCHARCLWSARPPISLSSIILHLIPSLVAVLLPGSVGFISYGIGWVTNMFAETVCDGGSTTLSGRQCLLPTTGQTCSFTCASGFFPLTGNTTRTCNMGRWSGSDLVCALSTCRLRGSMRCMSLSVHLLVGGLVHWKIGPLLATT